MLTELEKQLNLMPCILCKAVNKRRVSKVWLLHRREYFNNVSWEIQEKVGYSGSWIASILASDLLE